ncbi:hypothetical protein [Ferruginibacter sp.]
MKTKFIILFLVVSSCMYGQTGILEKYKVAASSLREDNFSNAYKILKEIEPQCDLSDTIYNYILWDYVNATTQVEKIFRDKEIFDSSLAYGLEALKLIEKGKPVFDEKFGEREYWMVKNIIVSYYGLGQIDKAQKYKDILYTAYKEKKLPQSTIGKYFNFSFFKWDGKNVWGYEWYADLPQNRNESSFSKVVYYVYSTNADGTDKEQLFRLHVLMFHKIDPSIKFDYVLTKRLETAKNEVSGTLYAYTYNENIDFKKLQNDIKEVLKGNYQPEAQTIIKKE